MYKLYYLIGMCFKNEQQGMNYSLHGCFGGDMLSCILIRLSIFIAAAFILSLIFWATYNLIAKDKKPGKQQEARKPKKK